MSSSKQPARSASSHGNTQPPKQRPGKKQSDAIKAAASAAGLSASYDSLALVLGDQLNLAHSWYDKPDPQRLFVLAELRQETDYCRHHVQKICAFFAAMAHFAVALREQGHDVLHLTLDDTAGFDSLPDLLAALTSHFSATEFHYQEPDEWRVDQQMRDLTLGNGTSIHCHASEHFLLQRDELEDFFTAGKHLRMENFYRKLRRRFHYLMDGDQPRGGKWNYDQANRKKLKQADLEDIPEPLLFSNPVSEILERLSEHQVDSFGSAARELPWPINRKQSLQLLEFFCRHCLPRFGHFQDAMTRHGEFRWSLYHSRLSFAINSKILSPSEVIERAIAEQAERPDDIDLAQIEGFVRQILGWREYIRGVYWVNAPDYGQHNHFCAKRDLPDFFWTGKTGMRCLSEAIGQSLDHAYAHHIQRLMVTGNFALLTELDPDQVDAWYLGIYIDALEWVEQPNTRGMALFADGGIVGTKPYAASGNYINKMSDYCGGCQYDVKLRSGPKSCPLNSFYWRFMDKHREQLSRNHRLGMLFGSWDKLAADEREAVLETARRNLIRIESL